MWPNPQKTADLVTFTEEVLNGNLHFLCGGEVNSNIFKKIIAALSSNETKLTIVIFMYLIFLAVHW